MRALEQRLGLSGLNYNAEKKVEVFKHRVASTKKVIDTSAPKSLHDRENLSPGKRYSSRVEKNRLIALDNMLLAKRIFNIMEAPGMIHEVIADTRHLDNHAGTMNFHARLEDAQRIHRNNQIIATRLDTVKGVLTKNDLRNDNHFNPLQARVESRRRKMKKLSMLQKKGQGRQMPEWDDTPLNTHRSENGEGGKTAAAAAAAKRGRNPYKEGGPSGSLSARRADSPGSGGPATGNISPVGRGSSHTPKVKPIKILLEYTKIQDSKVLDIAVVKEPFRDNFAVFGIDIDGGQRYELRLTSEDVASILDGDMLVTSIDSLEVWVALLNKVVLEQVDEFTKISAHENPEEIIRNSSALQNRGALKPAPPPPSSASRPNSSKPSVSRPGSGARYKPASEPASPPPRPQAQPQAPKALTPEPPKLPPSTTARRPSLNEVEEEAPLRPAAVVDQA